MDGIGKLAKLFKERENKPYIGPQIGKVIRSFPNIRIRLGNKIILEKEHLIISQQLMKKQGTFNLSANKELKNVGKITLETLDTISGETQTLNYEIVDLEIDKIEETNIEIVYGLEMDDEVILIPTTNQQEYYVIDKVVRP